MHPLHVLSRSLQEVRVELCRTRREFLRWSAVTFMGAAFPQRTSDRVSTVVGTGVRGTAADGDAANRAQINNPFHIVMGPDGAFYFSDFGTSRVFRWDLRSSRISVVAGTGSKGFAGDGGSAKSAQLNGPHEVRFDTKGNLYIDERDNHIVRRVDMKSGIISTVAGTAGKNGYGGDGGLATQALLNQPHGITLDT